MEKITPVIPSGIRRYIPYLLGITLFSIYLYTTSPTVYLGDSGELTASAFSLGIPHNSGYPLYSMLGKFFCLIPLGNIGFRLNLMSIFFSVFTVVLIYAIILRITASVLASLVASTFLAFTSLFWFQTVSAEVYPLHTFFVALMILILLWWEEKREFRILALFVFITGLSFGNHMQTVMLAPAVLCFIISGDRGSIFFVKHFSVLTILFLLALSLYIYLPIRTNAGAAIHWGDPDTLKRFWAHVSAQSHRSTYVFSTGISGYVERSRQYLELLWSQWGIVCVISFWGWLNLASLRWKLFFILVVIFDFIYTVFFNIISLQITPFGLPTLLVLAILLGVGLNALFLWLSRQKKVGPHTQRAVEAACVTIPIFAFFLNMGLCNQSRNYTAYEHAVNIFRTADRGDTIFMDADNNIFPVTYARIAEKMGQGIELYDRHNVIFRWELNEYPFVCRGPLEEVESIVQKKILENGRGAVYFAVFEPNAIDPPKGYRLDAYGVLKSVTDEKRVYQCGHAHEIWKVYVMNSIRGKFYKDYMNREVAGRYGFWSCDDLWKVGKRAEAIHQCQLASNIAYDDTTLHSDLGVWFADRGIFDQSRRELERALVYHKDMSGVQNNWGYYYYKKGDFENAIKSFRKAVKLNPINYTYRNNLAFTLYRNGNKKEALSVFKKSFQMKQDQPKTRVFLERHWPNQ